MHAQDMRACIGKMIASRFAPNTIDDRREALVWSQRDAVFVVLGVMDADVGRSREGQAIG